MNHPVVRDYRKNINIGTGRTYHTVEMCKRHDGLMVCLDQGHANAVAEVYGIETTTLAKVKDWKLLGEKRRTFYDPEVLIRIIEAQDEAINILREDKRELIGRLDK